MTLLFLGLVYGAVIAFCFHDKVMDVFRRVLRVERAILDVRAYELKAA